MPQTVSDRMKIADELVGGLLKNNVAVENIFVDPLVQPVSVEQEHDNHSDREYGEHGVGMNIG